MSYTRDWLNTTPLDHSKFKDQPGSVRNAKVDVEERLAAFIYGFTSGETESGFKYAPFIVQGTAPSSATNQIILHGSDVNSVCELWLVDESGNRMQLTSSGKLYLAGGGKLPNNTFLVAVNAAGTGLINVVKCTTGNVLEFLGSVLINSSGNVTIPGTCAVTGAAALGSLTIGGTGPNTAGGYVTQDANGIVKGKRCGAVATSYSANTIYQASADGIVECILTVTRSGLGRCIGFSGATASPPPATERGATEPSSGFETPRGSFSFRVNKGDFWWCTVSNGGGSQTAIINFTPEGD